jgi:antitoxin HigA-1
LSITTELPRQGVLASSCSIVFKKGFLMTRQVPYPHPGEILAEEFLKPMQVTPYRLAKEIHVPLTRIAAILAGKRAVTVDTALRLSRFFAMSDGFWIGLQMDYDTAVAKDMLAKELAAIATYNDERFALAA